MQITNSLTAKLRHFFIIFFPILVTQVSLMATGFADTVMSGQVSHYDLAGVAIGANIWVPILTGINGCLSGITPILAQLHGAKRHGDMAFWVVQGLYIAIFVSVLTVAGGWLLLEPILALMGLESKVHSIAREFLAALSLGMIPLFFSTVLRYFIDALGYTRVTMLVTLCAVPINIFLNYVLIFGNLGSAKLGGVGAGYASALTYWLLAFINLAVIIYIKPFSRYKVFSKWVAISLAAWKELIKVGGPIGLAIFCEVSIFGAVAILMAEFGTATIAAHQAAINFASLVYMVPLSIGMTLTIAVGFEVGAKRYRDAKQYSYLGIGLAVAVAGVFALCLLLLNDSIARLYSNEAEVLLLIKGFLVYAVFFQLSDAIAAPIQGALRGYKDVNVTFVMAVFSYWIIGMPTGYLLAKYTSLQAYGYWAGFIAGLAVGAIVLAFRLVRIQRSKRAHRD